MVESQATEDRDQRRWPRQKCCAPSSAPQLFAIAHSDSMSLQTDFDEDLSPPLTLNQFRPTCSSVSMRSCSGSVDRQAPNLLP